MRRRAQAGQVLVLAALLFVVLVGFAGLAIDGGEAAAQHQLVRNSADGAALAGAYSIFISGSTEAAATTLAGQVVAADGLPTTDLTMTYLDSSGTSTATAANVVTVRADVADSARTFFLGALGVRSVTITASATAAGLSAAQRAICAFCAMSSARTGLTVGSSGQVTVTGAPAIINSTASPVIRMNNNASFTAPAITIVRNSISSGSGTTISPAPTIGSAVADLLASMATPAVAGTASAYTAPPGSSSISPGVYSSITVPAGATLTLNPGIYVLTGSMTVTGTVGGSGVMLHLACPVYPTRCAAGAAGGRIAVTGGRLVLLPPSSGAYTGLSVFADRNNVASNTFTSGTFSVGGTWYTPLMRLTQTSTTQAMTFGQLIVDSVTLASSTTLTVSYSAGSTFRGSATLRLTL